MAHPPPPPRRHLPKAYEHPADRAATAALKSVPLLDVAVRKLIELQYERAVRQVFLASSIKIGPDQLPDVWRAYHEALETLHARAVASTAASRNVATLRQMRQWAQQFLRVTRTGADGMERIAFIGYVGKTEPRGDTVEVTAYAPEKLITDGPAPFPPPLAEAVTTPAVFDFWWKQLDYVFGLPDPRGFPPLRAPLGPKEQRTVTRFIRTASGLAGSTLLNVLEEKLLVSMPDGPHGAEEIEGRLSPPDIQAGFRRAPPSVRLTRGARTFRARPLSPSGGGSTGD